MHLPNIFPHLIALFILGLLFKGALLIREEESEFEQYQRLQRLENDPDIIAQLQDYLD
jgi:hypothetical protein